MSSDWSRKRGRDGEQKSSDEAPPAGGGEADRQHHQAPPQGHPPVPVGGPQRYPPGARAPDGYYQPVYPPPPVEGSAAYPPPRSYEGAPYGMPPHMAGYPPPMYPYPPHMYPPYPGYPAPPQMNPYGYPPPDPNMPGGHHPPGPPPPRGYAGEEGANVGPYGQVHPPAAAAPSSRRRSEEDEDRKPAARSEGSASTGGGEDDSTEAGSEAGPIVPGAVTARLKTYIKPRLPSTQDVVDRRSRKNSQSRARATKLRGRIGEIESKVEVERDEEESLIWSQYEQRRQRKNDRSRERAMERKEEIDRILGKAEKKRTKIEKSFLDTALYSKKRKNEGDRMRRQRLKDMDGQRLKDMGNLGKGSGMKPGILGRGPMAHLGYHLGPPYAGYGGHMGEIPMSPMPSMAMAHPHPHAMQSPGAYGSPGMMVGMFPSPQQYARRPAAAAPGAMETPGRQRAEQGGAPLPFIPPAQAYDAHAASPADHMQHHHSNRVAQRSNPDGSMSISIGANGAEGSSFDGEPRQPGADEQPSMNISDVSHLLLYNDGEGEGGENQESNGEEKEDDEEGGE